MKPGKPLTRTKGLSQGCGLRSFPDEIAAKLALATQPTDSSRHNEQPERQPRKCPGGDHWHLYPVPAGLGRKPAEHTPRAAPEPRKPARDTGFSRATKLLIRTRAGNGDPEQARCEACGIHLGLHGGQIQHIYARQAGGSAGDLYRSAANGAALCGTRYTGCHGLCEDRDPHMNEMGFWRKRNGQEKPGDYAVMLHSAYGSGVTVWLLPDGTYGYEAPVGGEAA